MFLMWSGKDIGGFNEERYLIIISSEERKLNQQRTSKLTVQFSSVAQSCLTFCDPMNHNMPGLPVHHQLPEFAQTHVHWWCHPTLSSSCLQSFPASGSFPEWVLHIGSQSIGASGSVLPVNIQDWFPLGLTGLISLQSKKLSRVFSNTTVQKHQFFGAQLSLWSSWFFCSSDGKEYACNAGDLGSIPGSGRPSGEGNGNPLQYSCLENPMDRGAWRASLVGHKESDTTEWLTLLLLTSIRLTTGKTIALTIQTFGRKVMSLLFNMLSGFVIAFFPGSKHLDGCIHHLQWFWNPRK